MGQLNVDPLCVVIGRTRHKMVQAEIQEAAKQGARLIELRLDFLGEAAGLQAAAPGQALPDGRHRAPAGRWRPLGRHRGRPPHVAAPGHRRRLRLGRSRIRRHRRHSALRQGPAHRQLSQPACVPPDLEQIHAHDVPGGRRRRQDRRPRPDAGRQPAHVLDLLKVACQADRGLLHGRHGRCQPRSWRPGSARPLPTPPSTRNAASPRACCRSRD